MHHIHIFGCLANYYTQHISYLFHKSNFILLFSNVDDISLGNSDALYPSLVDIPVTTMLTAVGSSSTRVECTQCGTTKKSGTSSCCARYGSWFKQCGDEGEKGFPYTWAEGIQACKSKFFLG